MLTLEQLRYMSTYMVITFKLTYNSSFKFYVCLFRVLRMMLENDGKQLAKLLMKYSIQLVSNYRLDSTKAMKSFGAMACSFMSLVYSHS